MALHTHLLKERYDWMKHPLFENLGDSYPHNLEEGFDRILIKIEELWDSPQIDQYFSELIIDKRGGRKGFPTEAMDEILSLRDYRETVKFQQAEREEDAILELARRQVSIEKESFLQAVNDGNIELVDMFVRANFNIHTEDSFGTPAILIAMKKGYTVIGRLLLNAGADIDARDRMGMSPLLLACGKTTHGYKEIAEMLINKGANINVKDKLGFTPLLLALTGDLTSIAELLIEKGADLNASLRTGQNALYLAEMSGNTRIVALILSKLTEHRI